jgi:hypothetical protein
MPEQLTPNPIVVATALHDGEMVLLRLDTAQTYMLNATGVHVWRCLTEGLSLEVIDQRLVAHYDVTPVLARCCVRDLVDDLQAHGLIVLTNGSDLPDAAVGGPVWA